ncbi:ankyrin repeat-containing domain protein [Aspergillus granulosus]|uniref:Ankyrin repeat-containing domain protein n=1 Tax=Aspergillus granulosus TaxID=176169 RepID=A0ABR4GVT0_9EURO
MSTALVKVGRLKPEIRLGQAISEFQTDLSTMQKAQFRSHQTKATTTPLEIRDVMQLTAEINRHRPHGRCFGPRLTNVLEAVQQFAALGDIVLGGTQNLLACGVWSLLRMTLLSAVNYPAYFERLSAMLMAAGRSAPRYQSLGTIYSKSERLRSYMMEYSIVLVHLCHHVLRLCRKSALAQWASTLNDSALNTFQSELELWATSIKEEVQVLMAQQNAEDNALTIWFRSHVGRQFNSLSHSRKLRARQRMMDACSTHDHESAWKQIRKRGNTTLLQTLGEYTQWKMRRESCTLICAGKLGSGKSVLLANIVDDLNLQAAGDTTIAYFFCQHDAKTSLKARTIIGVLARQLLYPVTDLDRVCDFLDDGPTMDIDRLLAMLRQIVSKDHHTYFVLDGLDHCDAKEADVVLDALRGLQTTMSLSVCVSFRSGTPDMRPPGREHLLQPSGFSIPEHHPDIDEYINSELQRCIEMGILTVGDPLLILEIQNSLSQGAQGMFLWVVLQIQALCLEPTDVALRQAILNLPRDLSEIYHVILEKAGRHGTGYQTQILELVMAACRPLTVDEVREVLGVTPGNVVWDPQGVPNDIYSTLACCGGLLTVDEESFSVQVIHHSVITFLVSGYQGFRQFTMTAAHKTMARIIITFLNYEVFSQQISTVRAPNIRAGSVTASVISTTAYSLGQSQKLALRLLRMRRGGDKDIGHTLLEAMGEPERKAMLPLAFHDYASSWWQEHIWCLAFHDESTKALLKGLILSVDPNRPDSQGRTPLSHVATRELDDVVELLLGLGALDIPDSDHKTPLMRAIVMNKHTTVRLMLRSKSSLPNAVDGSQQTPLLLAVKARNAVIVSLLVQHPEVLINTWDADGRTPLMWAVIFGFEEGVNLLLASSGTPLHAAASHADEGIINSLIRKGGLGLNVTNKQNRTPLWIAAANATPLWIAACNGHCDVVLHLVRLNAVSVNIRNKKGYTPLAIAAKHGHEMVIRILLESGKVFPQNVSNNHALDPLWLAVDRGHAECVRALAPLGAHTLPTNVMGQTPFGIAAAQGRHEIVRIIAGFEGIDLNARDDTLATPLWVAAANGHQEVVKVLTRYPSVDVHAQNRDGLTPLAVALGQGHVGVVAALIALSKVDPNTEDKAGTTLLWHCQPEVIDAGSG